MQSNSFSVLSLFLLCTKHLHHPIQTGHNLFFYAFKPMLTPGNCLTFIRVQKWAYKPTCFSLSWPRGSTSCQNLLLYKIATQRKASPFVFVTFLNVITNIHSMDKIMTLKTARASSQINQASYLPCTTSTSFKRCVIAHKVDFWWLHGHTSKVGLVAMQKWFSVFPISPPNMQSCGVSSTF